MNAFVAEISDKGRTIIEEIVDGTDWSSATGDTPGMIETLSQRRTLGRDRIAATYGVAAFDDYNGLSGESQTGLQRDDGLILASDWYEEFWFVLLIRDDDHIAATTVEIPAADVDDERADQVLREILAYYVAFAEGADVSEFPNTEV